MSSDPVDVVKDIYRRSVAAVHPSTVVPEHVHLDRNGQLHVADLLIDTTRQPVYAIAIGKAAGEMVYELESILGGRLTDAIAVTKSVDPKLTVRSRVLIGSHPVPDERSLAAGEAVLKFASEIPPNALVICLISGGGSALVESLHPGITLDDLQDATHALLRAGASIHELNAVRSRMSRLKAGGLLHALRHTTVVNLIISDVLGDDLSTIASGPTIPPMRRESAEDVLQRYGMSQGLPAPIDKVDDVQPATRIVASLSKAIDAASKAARDHGLEPVVLSRSLDGEARHVASTLAAIAAASALAEGNISRGSCIICGGETTVTVHGDGAGGRNTESALAAALRLWGVENIAMGFLATDGDDGTAGVAGAIVTGSTIPEELLPAALDALRRNDSYTFLHSLGVDWETGSTGTNVNDLIIAAVP